MISASWTSSTGIMVNFEVHSIDSDWNDVGGIYMMCRRNPGGGWNPAYIGKAKSLRSRLCAHPQWADAQGLGATHVLAVVVPTESDRDRIEAVLVGELHPPLNVQLRQLPRLGIIASVVAQREPPTSLPTPFTLADMAGIPQNGLLSPRKPPPVTHLLASALEVGKRTV